MNRTLEQRIKFDLGLPVGVSTILVKRGEVERLCLVDIGPRGAVYVLLKPELGDMYITWERLKADKFDKKKLRMVGVYYVHADKVNTWFTEPVATLELPSDPTH